MTPRERVIQTLEFRNTSDRVPRELWTLPWADNNFPDELAEIRHSFPNDIAIPHVIYQKKSPMVVGEQYKLGLYIDPWGCRFNSIQEGIIGEVKESIVDPDDEEWEDISRIHIPEELLSFDIDQVNTECAKDDRFLLADCLPRPFEQLQFIRGTENLFVDLAMGSTGMLTFLEQMHDFYCRLVEKWCQTDVDGIWIMDDWGSERDLLINPKTWCEIFLPLYKDYINIAKKYGKKTFMHSDGNTMRIIPYLIDAGLDAFNTQIFCMDREQLKQYCGKITFWGEIDRQWLLPYATTDEIRAAVRGVYEDLWADGGCIAQCEFGIGAKPENVRAVFDEWNKVRC